MERGKALLGALALLLAPAACGSTENYPGVNRGGAWGADRGGGGVDAVAEPGGGGAGSSGRGAGSAGGGAGSAGGGAGSAGGGAGSTGVVSAGHGDVAPSTVPYANVTAVSVTGSAGNYTFSVAVESSDVNCTQYANWWEVLGEDGALLYRRILDHPHTDANGTSDPDAPGNTFTRTGGPVDLAADTVVIVRAHMNTGGYNGMVMRGSPAALFVAAPDIGGAFAPSVETAPPQPTACQET